MTVNSYAYKMKLHLLFAIALNLWFAACQHEGYLVKDFHRPPSAWKQVGPAPGEAVLSLKIGLAQRDFAELERQLYEVSDPRNARYGQYLSSAAVHDLVRPHSHVCEAIESWLENAGFGDRWRYNSAKTWIDLPVSVDEAEKLLRAKYYTWRHTDGTELLRTTSWSLPADIHSHITTIQPTNSWAKSKPRLPIIASRNSQYRKAEETFPDIPPPPDSAIASLCNFSAVTPDCIRTLYGTASYTVKTNDSKLGICNYLGEYNNRSDTYQFLEMYRPEAADVALNFTQISVANGTIDNGTSTANQEPDIGFEGNLDSQYMIGVGYPLNVRSWSTGGLNPSFMPDLVTPTDSDEPYLTWTNYILNQSDGNIPQIISTSYGDDEQTVSYAYAHAVCNEMAQISARGVTLLFASGDYGVGTDGECVSNKDNSTRMFLPSFPNDCPYVTNVGATKDYPEVAAYKPFKGQQPFTSGGGFSNYFGVPDYQKDTVGKYVADLNGLFDGLYNKSGKSVLPTSTPLRF